MINAEQTGSNMLYIINARHLMKQISIEFAKRKWNIYDMCVILVVYIKTSATINNDHDVFMKKTNALWLLVSSSVTVILPILAWELPFLLEAVLRVELILFIHLHVIYSKVSFFSFLVEFLLKITYMYLQRQV